MEKENNKNKNKKRIFIAVQIFKISQNQLVQCRSLG